MSETARDRGWGDPTTRDYERVHIEKMTAAGLVLRLRYEVVDIFRYTVTELAKHYPLKGYADDYGYCCRPIRGYEDEWRRTHDFKYLSNHSWGLAVDLDSSVNPMSSDPDVKHEFVRAIVEPIIAPFQGRLIWGGDYKGSRKDYMHIEYTGTPSEAKSDSAHARTLLAPAPPKPTPTPENDMIIIHSPSHSYVRLPGAIKLDPKTTLPIYRDKFHVPVVELADADWMALVTEEKNS